MKNRMEGPDILDKIKEEIKDCNKIQPYAEQVKSQVKNNKNMKNAFKCLMKQVI